MATPEFKEFFSSSTKLVSRHATISFPTPVLWMSVAEKSLHSVWTLRIVSDHSPHEERFSSVQRICVASAD